MSPAAYSGDIDSALVAKLLGDSTLMALLPHGVFFDIAGSYLDAGVPKRATKFVMVKLMSHSVERMFGGRAYEGPTYLVKAVTLQASGADAKTAGARIDTLLDGGTLVITGYDLMYMALEEYVRYTEEDPSNPDARWHHRGGLYGVMASPSF